MIGKQHPYCAPTARVRVPLHAADVSIRSAQTHTHAGYRVSDRERKPRHQPTTGRPVRSAGSGGEADTVMRAGALEDRGGVDARGQLTPEEVAARPSDRAGEPSLDPASGGNPRVDAQRRVIRLVESTRPSRSKIVSLPFSPAIVMAPLGLTARC